VKKPVSVATNLQSFSFIVSELVRSDHADLSMRQTAILFMVYDNDGRPYSVKDLAAALNLSKPAVTRALDRLGELKLTTRETDKNDRRMILVQRTEDGYRFLSVVAGFAASSRATAGSMKVAA
jgi:DNA-binding MarR family transcriptional regulator